MNLLDKIGREFSGYNLLESGKRIFDRKPLQCSLYLTDKCNLDCSYCTEYDNSKPHPKLEDLKLWIRKIRDLGTMRIALVGGEPLLHPNVVEIVRYCRELGFATSLTTNGFLLTRKLLKELEEAGLQVMQISVDRMTPSPITKKSFKTILPKLDYFKDSKISLHITGVICAGHPAGIEGGAGNRFVPRNPDRGAPGPCRSAQPVSGRARLEGRARGLRRFHDRAETSRRKNSHERSDPELSAQPPAQRAGRLDLHGGLQAFLRLGPGEVLDLQHGAHGEAHHGHHAGRSLCEQSQEVVPGRVRRLLRREHVADGAKAGDGADQGNRLTRETHSRFVQAAGRSPEPTEPSQPAQARRPCRHSSL